MAPALWGAQGLRTLTLASSGRSDRPLSGKSGHLKQESSSDSLPSVARTLVAHGGGISAQPRGQAILSCREPNARAEAHALEAATEADATNRLGFNQHDTLVTRDALTSFGDFPLGLRQEVAQGPGEMRSQTRNSFVSN